jgi:uncharacterized protein YegL
MRSDLTDITVVLDRSGSMAACKDVAEAGLNQFIEGQKKRPGAATFTLVQFDTEYEFVHRGADIGSVGPCRLVPRGNTALLDAVGRAVIETGERLRAMAEADRPGLVVVVILTDGQENSSREFTLGRVRDMICHQQDVYNWQFTFLGANQDAFAEAGAMGIPVAQAANFAAHRADRAFAATCAQVGRMRDYAFNKEAVVNEFLPEERADMAD